MLPVFLELYDRKVALPGDVDLHRETRRVRPQSCRAQNKEHSTPSHRREALATSAFTFYTCSIFVKSNSCFLKLDSHI